MTQTFPSADSTLAAIETALPVEPQSYTIGDRFFFLDLEEIKEVELT